MGQGRAALRARGRSSSARGKAALSLLVLSIPAWGWSQYRRWGRVPETVAITGQLRDWSESQQRLRRGKAPGWEFYFRVLERPERFRIPSMHYSKDFACEDCPNIADFRGPGYSRAHRFDSLEKPGSRLEFLADKEDLESVGGAMVAVYALKTDKLSYLSWEDSRRRLKERRPGDLIFALGLTALGGALLWLIWNRG